MGKTFSATNIPFCTSERIRLRHQVASGYSPILSLVTQALLVDYLAFFRQVALPQAPGTYTYWGTLTGQLLHIPNHLDFSSPILKETPFQQGDQITLLIRHLADETAVTALDSTISFVLVLYQILDGSFQTSYLINVWQTPLINLCLPISSDTGIILSSVTKHHHLQLQHSSKLNKTALCAARCVNFL